MKPRRRAIHTSAAALLLAAVAALGLAACGSGDGASTSPTPSYSPSAGLGTVLVVVPDNDFQQREYQAVRTALGDAGYPAQIANVEGGDSASGDVHVRADLKIADAQAADYVGVVLIGGPGATALFDDDELQALVREAAGNGEVVAAICLAPVVLARAGVLEGKQATVWSDETAELEGAGCSVQDAPVVVDGSIVTGNGPDAAPEFAAAVVRALQAGD
jgi:protease I